MSVPLNHQAFVHSTSIPLLDASSLPASDDWALLESIHAGSDATDFDADFDRFGQFRVNAAYDE